MTYEALCEFYRFCYRVDFKAFSELVHSSRPVWEEGLKDRHWLIFSQDPLRYVASYAGGRGILEAFQRRVPLNPVD